MKTHPNPLLEEIWEIKDRLAAEAGGDIQVFYEQLHAWSAAHPHAGPVVNNAADLRELLARKEQEKGLMLREKPAEYGKEKD